jgi:hypothetical protein
MIKKQIQRFKDRRLYRTIISGSSTSYVNATYSFASTPIYVSKVIISNENVHYLKLCKKSGSWISLKLFKKRFSFWTSRNLMYFRRIDSNLIHTRNFGIGVITGAMITTLSKARIKHVPIDNSLNIYNHEISTSKSINFSEGFYMCVNGSDQYQHFIQDFLPILAFVRPFLRDNPNMPLILKKSIKNVKQHEYYFDLLEIRNPLIYIDDNDISIENLYILDFIPISAIYCLPQEIYSCLYRIVSQNKTYEICLMKNLVLFIRNEVTRNFFNQGLLEDELMLRSKSLGLNPIFLNPSVDSLDSVIDTLSNARYVFAMHGGAVYNMIFAAPDCTLIEFITTDSTDSVSHMIRSFGMSYMPYAINASKGSVKIEVTKTDLDNIFYALSLS